MRTLMVRSGLARTTLVGLVALLTGAGLVVTTAAASTPDKKKKPPVELEGKVENGGRGAVEDGAVEIAADDFLFSPTFVRASRGETVAVTVANQGNVPHTFTARDDSFDEEVAPGDEVTVEVSIPTGKKPVAFFCQFHESSGMQGALFTKKGKKAEKGSSGSSGSDDSGGAGTTPTTDSGLGYGY